MNLSNITTKLFPIALGLATAFFLAWSQFSNVPVIKALEQRVESLAYDLRLNTSLPDNQTPDRRVVIVDVDEKSLAAEGRWPWPRNKIADLTDRLFEAGVVVIGFDIFFSEPERNTAGEVLSRLQRHKIATPPRFTQTLQKLTPEFDNDSRLAKSLRKRDVTLGYLFHEENSAPVGRLPQPLLKLTPEAAKRSGIKSMSNYTGSLPVLQDAAVSSGFVTTWPDPDGIIRRTPMVIRHGNNIYGSLSLNVAKLYLFLENIEIKTAPIGKFDAAEKIILGGTTIPTDGFGFSLVPFRGPTGSFPYVSATDVLNGAQDTETLEGAIVIIGSTAVGIADLVATPVENIYPGVEIHATMISAILDNYFPTEPSWADGANLIITLGLGIILALILPYLSPILLLTTALITSLSIIYGNIWLWQEKGLGLALAWPLILILSISAINITYGFLSENLKRAQLKNMFGQYVPPQLVDIMAHDASSYGFEGESREMTVLFADIRGFTTLSEKLSPADLRSLLNRYFTHMTEIIFKHQGTIDKYVGDMIMAFWGAPVRDSNHAQHAIEAAMEMLAKTDELKPKLMAEGYPEIDIGIGLNTGMMNVGDMGSSYRRAYTVLGDNVNLGSRIEGLTKFYGARLVVGETTRENQEQFVFRKLDQVKVKGKTKAVTVYEPICRSQDATHELMAELRQHDNGLDAYLEQDWDSAEQTFNSLAAAHADTRIYQLYLERIIELRKRNPGPEWDGVYERREK